MCRKRRPWCSQTTHEDIYKDTINIFMRQRDAGRQSHLLLSDNRSNLTDSGRTLVMNHCIK